MAMNLQDVPKDQVSNAFTAEVWPHGLLREAYNLGDDGRSHTVQVEEFAAKAFRECEARN